MTRDTHMTLNPVHKELRGSLRMCSCCNFIRQVALVTGPGITCVVGDMMQGLTTID